jgi:hypothetical protein
MLLLYRSKCFDSKLYTLIGLHDLRITIILNNVRDCIDIAIGSVTKFNMGKPDPLLNIKEVTLIC